MPSGVSNSVWSGAEGWSVPGGWGWLELKGTLVVRGVRARELVKVWLMRRDGAGVADQGEVWPG